MSDVYSSFERDHFAKKSKKRQQDFKSNKSTTRGYKVYEPKTSDKSQLKNEQYPSDHKGAPQPSNDYHDYDNYEDYNEYDHYDSKNSRYDKHDNYRHKSHNKSGKRSVGASGKYPVWKEVVKVNKDAILQSHEATPVNNNIDGLVRENSNLFVKEKQSPVNKDALELGPNDMDNQLYHKSSGESVASASTNATTDDRKSMETLDMAFDNPDAIRLSLNQMAGRSVVSDSNSAKKKDQDKKENKIHSRNKECKDDIQVNEALSDKTELNEDLYAKKNGKIFRDEGRNEKGCEETDESEGERCSNIDGVVERKLLNHEVGSNSDVFDELGNEAKKEEMEALEDNTKSKWAETDPNQTARADNNYSSPSAQDLSIFFTALGIHDRKTSLFFGDDEDHDDNFSELFSLRPVGKTFFGPSIDTNIKSDIFGEHDGSKSATTDKDISATLSSTSKLNGCPETPTSTSFSSHISYLQQKLGKQGLCDFNQNTPVVPSNTNIQGAVKMTNPYEDQVAPPGFDKPKFVFKYCGHNYEAKIWFYTDTKNLIQGPFSAREMDEWYTVNNLPSNLSISKGMGNNSTFKPLSYFVDRAIQKEIQNLSYDNDYLYYPNPIESGSSGTKAQVDPSVQEAQDILAAVNQYSFQAAREMEISHNIRETFIDEPAIEINTPNRANIFAQGAPRQSRRLAVFDTCNDTTDPAEQQQTQASPKSNTTTTNSELANQILSLIKNDAGACQNVYNQDLSSPTVPCSSENNIRVNNSVLNSLSNLVVNVKSEVEIHSPVNSPSIKQDSSLEKSNTPDYRTQPLSATQIQMLQNFSWQAFADVSMKSTQVSSAMNP